MSISVELSFHVYSSAPGFIGNWSYYVTRELPCRPVAGDWVELPGGACFEIEHVTFLNRGVLLAVLRRTKTDNPQEVKDLNRLCDHGWKRLGAPWAGWPDS